MKQYHFRLLLAVVSGGLLAAGLASPALANSTQVSELVSSGLLALSAPSSATLSSTLVSFSTSATAAGSLGQLEADDDRGSNAGWSLTATASNFVHIGQAQQTSGSTPVALSAGGSYNGSTSGAYILTITQGGGRGTAQFSVSGLETQAATTIPASDTDLNLGTHGVLVDFPDTTYQVGESWRVPIAVIPPTNLTIQPSAVTARYGDPTGVHAGVGHVFGGTADSATIMTADTGFGTGAYLNTPTLNLQVPPVSPSGFYFATITETLN